MYREYCRRRRAKRKELNEVYNMEDIKYTYMLFNNECVCCGSTDKLEIDHHIPLSKGKVLTRTNAVLLCRSCNARKSALLPEEFYTKEQLDKINKLLCL